MPDEAPVNPAPPHHPPVVVNVNMPPLNGGWAFVGCAVGLFIGAPIAALVLVLMRVLFLQLTRP